MVRGTNFMKNIIYIVLCMFASAGLAQVYPGNPYHFKGDFTGSGMISNSGTAGTATNGAASGFTVGGYPALVVTNVPYFVPANSNLWFGYSFEDSGFNGAFTNAVPSASPPYLTNFNTHYSWVFQGDTNNDYSLIAVGYTTNGTQALGAYYVDVIDILTILTNGADSGNQSTGIYTTATNYNSYATLSPSIYPFDVPFADAVSITNFIARIQSYFQYNAVNTASNVLNKSISTVILFGDSLYSTTNSVQGTNTWQLFACSRLSSLYGTSNLLNFAVQGKKMSDMVASYTGTIHPYAQLNPNSPRNILIADGGINDLNGYTDTVSLVTCESNFVNFWSQATTDNFYRVATTLAYNSLYTNFQAYTAFVIAHTNLYDALIRADLYTFPTYDNIHFTILGSSEYADMVCQTLTIGNNLFVQNINSAGTISGSGSGLTNIPASALKFGTTNVYPHMTAGVLTFTTTP